MSLQVYTHSDIAPLINHRPLETKVGEALTLLPLADQLSDRLAQARALGARFALLGVPEDIGPRANMGRGGANEGWQAFLQRFLNLQSHPGFDCRQLALVGALGLSDLQCQSEQLCNQRPEQLQQLRAMVERIDEQLAPVVAAIANAGLVPIVIGGGHNNAYPILKGMHQALAEPLGALNIDPHSDFRPAEGRHSGNGFRYAYDGGHLRQYQVLGMHRWKNSADSQQAFAAAGFGCVSYQRLYQRRAISLEEAVTQLCQPLSGMPAGLELDLDVINQLPASAYTNTSLTLQDVEHAIFLASKALRPAYLHLCEAAPKQHPAGTPAGFSDCGQALSTMVLAFLEGYQ